MSKIEHSYFKISERIGKVPPYPFAALDKAQEMLKARHPDWKILKLGIGDPDKPTDPRIRKALIDAVENDFSTHRYPKYEGHPKFREACANWFEKRFGVRIDPKSQIYVTNGSKEALMHMIWGVVDKGDTVLVPDPFYPVYKMGCIFCNAKIHYMPLKKKNSFLIDYKKIPEKVADKAALLFVNYPNNPTSKQAGLEFFRETIEFAKKHKIAVVSDNAYSEVYYGAEKPPSIFEVDGAMDVAIELHSFSKSFNMTGWRLGFAVGNPDLIHALEIIKNNTDSGVFTAIQFAGIRALELYEEIVPPIRDLYRNRRDRVVPKLQQAGFDVTPCEATLYLWIQAPKGENGESFAKKLLEEKGVVVGPGKSWGEEGEKFFRICLSTPDEDLDEAIDRIIELQKA